MLAPCAGVRPTKYVAVVVFFSLCLGCNPRLNYVSVLLSLAINQPSGEAEKQALVTAGVIIAHGGQVVTVPLGSTVKFEAMRGWLSTGIYSSPNGASPDSFPIILKKTRLPTFPS